MFLSFRLVAFARSPRPCHRRPSACWPLEPNAIDDGTSKALAGAFGAVEADPGVWTIVLTGAGNSGGMDLKAFAGGGNVMGVTGVAGTTRRDCPEPLIAAVAGHALAGGFEIVLVCGLASAAKHATFGVHEVQRRLAAGAGGVVRPQAGERSSRRL